MTEYTARSAHAGSRCKTHVHSIGDFVHVTAVSGDNSATTAHTTDGAREVARYLLALADEIDGGEKVEAPLADWERDLLGRPKVGDRVTIVRAYPEGRIGLDDGKPGVLIRIDEANDIYPYEVRPDDGSRPSGVWVHAVRRIEAEEAAPAPAYVHAPSVSSPRQLAALKEAQALIDAGQAEGDTVTVARFLLGE